MNYTEKISLQLKEQGLKRTWLAEQLGLRYADFWRKMKSNDFTNEEKSKIKILIVEDSEEKRILLKKARTRHHLKELMKEYK